MRVQGLSDTCFQWRHRTHELRESKGFCPTLTAYMGTGGNNAPIVAADGYLRFITPLECERLMGFPDGWTDITYKGKTAPKMQRYKALGNSIAVTVLQWLGVRIDAVDKMIKDRKCSNIKN